MKDKVKILTDQENVTCEHEMDNKKNHDYTRTYVEHIQSRQPANSRNSSFDSPRTDEQLMKPIQDKFVGIQRDRNNLSDVPFEAQKVADQVQQGKKHLELPDQPPDIPEILGNFQLAIAKNLAAMEKVVDNAKEGGSIDERALRKLHSMIYGSKIGCGIFYYSIRNNIDPAKIKVDAKIEAIAKQLFMPFKDFQKALIKCAEELDGFDTTHNPFPWKSGKYENSEEQLYGIEPRSKIESDKKRDLSLQEQEKLESSYKAIHEAAGVLNHYLECLIRLGIGSGAGEEKWKEAIQLSKKWLDKNRPAKERQEMEKPRSKL